MTRSILALLVVVLAVLTLLTPAVRVTADTTAPTMEGVKKPVAVDENYRIVEEDVLQVTVWGEQQLSGSVPVMLNGKANLPFLGEVQAAGLTQAELAEVVKKRLAEEGIVYDAKVQITVTTIHTPLVRVLGQVVRAGTVSFKEGDRILDAIASAGGYTDNAMLENATLTRKGPDSQPIPIDLRKMFHGDLSQNFELKNGDTIYIPPEDYQNKIYVLGNVYRPGPYPLKDNTTVLSAITLAGGPTERGVLKSTMVVRGDPAKPERVACNLTRLIDKGDLTQNILLKAGDIVIVPESKKPNWTQISQILGTIMNITYLRRYGLF